MIAWAPGALFHDVDLVMNGDHALATWSDRTGGFVRRVDPAGRPLGEAHRLGPPCDGGIAAARAAGRWSIACLRRAVPEKDTTGGVTLFVLEDDLSPVARRRFGRAGRYSRGISIAAADDTAWVAWHDGTPGEHAAWVVRSDEHGGGPEPWRFSREGLAAGAPSVLVQGGEPVLAWAETWFNEDGYLVGQILTSNGRAAPTEVAVIIHDDPRPVLMADAAGLVVGWRDEMPAGTRPRLVLQRLDEDLAPRGEPRVVGRANGLGRPYLLSCDGALTTVAPRTHGRWEVLVGINRLDAELERLTVERQIYEYGVDFSLAAAACAGDHVLLLAAERGNTAQRQVRIRTSTIDCR